MGWKFKLLRDSMTGLVPGRHFVRKKISKLWPRPIQVDEWTLTQGFRQIEMIKEAGGTVEGKTVFELGTGWYPIIPLLFHLSGAKKVIMVDTQRLIDIFTFERFLEALSGYSGLIASKLKVNKEFITSKLKISKSATLDLAFSQFNLQYIAPSDARYTEFSDGSVDIVISRSVLAHIPESILYELTKEFYRILPENALMCHIVDNSDHFEHIDKTISRLHFLTFNNMLMRLTALNPFTNLNRLRHYEYIQIFSNCGFKVVFDDSPPDYQALKDLETMKICYRYKNISHQELARLTSYLVVQKMANIENAVSS